MEIVQLFDKRQKEIEDNIYIFNRDLSNNKYITPTKRVVSTSNTPAKLQILAIKYKPRNSKVANEITLNIIYSKYPIIVEYIERYILD